jgi:hypothetical protein
VSEAVTVRVKLVPGVRAETPKRLGTVVLQVTDSLVPRLESNVTMITLLAVTAVVDIVAVVADAAAVKLPEAADEHAPVELAQLVAVPSV